MSNLIITPEEDRRRQNQLLEDADRIKRSTLFNKTLGGQDILSASPTELDKGKFKHSYDPKTADRKNFDEKIFMFPESYNALRRELVDHWPTLWQQVQWRMANKPEEFIECMNAACDVAVVFDTEAVDFISKTYLGRLKQMRGLTS